MIFYNSPLASQKNKAPWNANPQNFHNLGRIFSTFNSGKT